MIMVKNGEILISVEITNHLGMNPNIGGIPPSESKFKVVIGVRCMGVVMVKLNLEVECFSM